jgi:hypothetical protein
MKRTFVLAATLATLLPLQCLGGIWRHKHRNSSGSVSEPIPEKLADAQSPLEKLGPIYVQSSNLFIQHSVDFDIAVACGQLANRSNADTVLDVAPIVSTVNGVGHAHVTASLAHNGSVLWEAKSVDWTFSLNENQQEILENLTTSVGEGVMNQFEAKYPGCQDQRLPANVTIYVTPGTHPDGNTSDEPSPLVAAQLKKDGFDVVASPAEADLLLEYRVISTTSVFVPEDYKVNCTSDSDSGKCSDNEGNSSSWTSSSDGTNYSSSTTVSSSNDPPGHYEDVPLAYGWRLLIRQGPGDPLMFVTSKQLDINEVEQALRKKMTSLMLPN